LRFTKCVFKDEHKMCKCPISNNANTQEELKVTTQAIKMTLPSDFA